LTPGGLVFANYDLSLLWIQLAMPGDRIRLLALDGGGVRGLSSLMILQQLMSTIDPERPPKPCDYFDMIGGTSTGGTSRLHPVALLRYANFTALLRLY
jgi:Patatin-like phospholipase